MLRRFYRWAAAILVAGCASAVLAAPVTIPTRESELRRVLAWQVALERVGFSPGIIDGKVGPKVRLATREFQRVKGLPQTGELDDATAKALDVKPDSVLVRYVIDPRDMDEIGPVPESWVQKSKLRRLGHESLDWVLAERFHCSRELLAALNPRVRINDLGPGDRIIVPVVEEPASFPLASRLEVNLAEKVIRVIDDENRLVGLFHCSVAADKAKLPNRDATVVVIAPDPTYKFDPKMWPEVKERISAPLMIPPGPRNPVGRCWIGLSLPGYGMHGTPNPELIGKTGSHGCFRLANWDAIRLSRMVKVGTRIKFSGREDVQLASRR